MKNLSLAFVIFTLLLFESAFAQNICNTNGNLIVFSNYDGGVLNISIDQNIPDLKIGICTYEPVQVNINGAFVSNVSQVIYAGYNSTQANNNCGIGDFPTSISGVSPGITSIVVYPPASVSNPNGWPNIICSYQCSVNENMGGCNTPEQVVAYFQQATNATFRYHFTQYNCWLSTQTYTLSQGGNCCESGLAAPVASFTANQNQICENSCVNFTNTSSGGPFSSVIWSFPGGTPASSNEANPTSICYNTAGSYPVSLTVSNSAGTQTTTQQGFITVSESFEPQLNFSYTNPTCKSTDLAIPILQSGFTTGGTFSITPSANINSNNGNVSLGNLSSGEYTVTYSYTGNQECILQSNTSQTAILNLLETPVAGFTYNQINNFNVQFSNTSQSGANYLWNFGNGNTSTGENVTFNFNIEGTYSVSLIVSNACGADTFTQNVIVQKLLSIDNSLNPFNPFNAITIYPNPASDLLFIRGYANQNQSGRVEFSDPSGRLLFNQSANFDGDWLLSIPVSDYESGVYFISIIGEKGAKVQKCWIKL